MTDVDAWYSKFAAAAGLGERDARRAIRFSGWDRDRFAAERRTPGWAGRMLAEASAREHQQIVDDASRRIRKLVGTSGPEAMSGLNTARLLECCRPGALRDLAMTWSPREHGGVMVCGPTGLGKTAAAVAILRRVWAEPFAAWWCWADAIQRSDPSLAAVPSCAWVRAFDLVNSRLQTALGKGESETVWRAATVDFLVIDDLGWESPRATAEDVVMEVVSMRYDRGVPTYVSSGLQVDAVVARYGDAFVRKIQNSGGRRGKVLSLW